MLNTSTIQSNAVQYYLQTNLAEVVLDDDFPIPLLINKWIQCLYSWYILRIVCQCQLQCSSRGEEESISSKNIATIFPKRRGSRGYRESWFSWHSDTVIDVTRNRLFECYTYTNNHTSQTIGMLSPYQHTRRNMQHNAPQVERQIRGRCVITTDCQTVKKKSAYSRKKWHTEKEGGLWRQQPRKRGRGGKNHIKQKICERWLAQHHQ